MFGREICRGVEAREAASGMDIELLRRRPDAVPLPPASWIAFEPPIAAREPDEAREMDEMEVAVPGEEV